MKRKNILVFICCFIICLAYTIPTLAISLALQTRLIMNDTQAPVMYTENDVVAPLYKNQPVATLAVLADYLWTSKDTLKSNLKKNPNKFIEGKHYFNISHENLKGANSPLGQAFDYKGNTGIQVWTERGCARLSKLLRTDAAWDLWELMEESYFNKQQPQLPKIPQSYSEALLLAGKLAEEKEKALATIERKNELLLISNDSSISVGEILVEEFVKGGYGINVGRNKFYRWLRQYGYVFKNKSNGKSSNQPMQKYVEKGWFTYKPVKARDGKVYKTLLITPKGKVLLAADYKSHLEEKARDDELAFNEAFELN